MQCDSPRLWCMAGLFLTLGAWPWTAQSHPKALCSSPWHISLQGMATGEALQQPHCPCWASIPLGCPLLLWWPLQASTGWGGVEQSLQDWLGQETTVSRKWCWLCAELKLLLPKKCFAIWNIKMLTFLYDGGICFWKFVCFPKHSTSFCTTVDFQPPHTLPLG